MSTSSLSKREMILNGSIVNTLINLSLPLIFGSLAQTLYNLADSYWVSNKIGYQAFAAIGYVWPIIFVFLAFSVGLSVATTSLISQSVGKEEYDKANRIAGQLFIISLFIGISFGLLGSLLTPWLISLMGAKGELYRYSVEYLQIVFLELPFLFMYHVYKSMKNSQGDTLSPTILLFISVGLNIILDPIFIVTLGLGVRGAALATVISRLSIAGYLLKKMFDKESPIHISKEYLRLDMPVLKNILKIALPSTVGQTISALGFVIMNRAIVSYGDETIAAFSLGSRITSLFMMPAFGISGALSTFIGQNIGAKQFDRAKRSVTVAVIFSFSLLSAGSVLVYFIKEPIILFFISDSKEVFELSVNYINVLCFVFPLMAIFLSFIGVFSGSGHTKYTLYLTLSRLWLLRIPMIILFGRYTNLGSNGIWYSMLISNLIVCVIGYYIIKSGKWLKATLDIRLSFYL